MWWPAERYITHFFGNSILVQNHWRKISNSDQHIEWWKMWQYKVIACKFTWHFSTWNTKFYRNFPLWWDASESASPLAPTPGENMWKECHRKHLKGTDNVLEPCTDSLSLSLRCPLSGSAPLPMCFPLCSALWEPAWPHDLPISAGQRTFEVSRLHVVLLLYCVTEKQNRTGSQLMSHSSIHFYWKPPLP